MIRLLERVSQRTQMDLVILAFFVGTVSGFVGGAAMGYGIGLAIGYNQMPLSECLSLVHR